MKYCTCCKETKDVSEFYKSKSTKSGLHQYCKPCTKLKIKAVPNYKEKRKAYLKSVPDKCLAYCRKWQNKNKDKILEYRKKYYAKNVEKTRKYQKENRERLRLNTSKWKKKNKRLMNSYSSLARARKIKRTPKWANLEKINQIYVICPVGYHVDHIIPLNGKIVSGLHVEYNLQYLPAEENLKKSNNFIIGD
jgi:hypothetical protein